MAHVGNDPYERRKDGLPPASASEHSRDRGSLRNCADVGAPLSEWQHPKYLLQYCIFCEGLVDAIRVPETHHGSHLRVKGSHTMQSEKELRLLRRAALPLT